MGCTFMHLSILKGIPTFIIGSLNSLHHTWMAVSKKQCNAILNSLILRYCYLGEHGFILQLALCNQQKNKK